MHLGAGAAQTKRKLIATEKRLQRGCWWPEDKSGNGTNFQANCYLAEAALPDRQIQEAMTLNRCKQAVSALKFCY